MRATLLPLGGVTETLDTQKSSTNSRDFVCLQGLAESGAAGYVGGVANCDALRPRACHKGLRRASRRSARPEPLLRIGTAKCVLLVDSHEFVAPLVAEVGLPRQHGYQ